MESVELCARLTRLLRSDEAAQSVGEGELRAALDAVAGVYQDGGGPRDPSLSSVADLILAALQRLLVTTLRESSRTTQERGFVALSQLVAYLADCIDAQTVIDLVQTCALYLPAPSTAVPAGVKPEQLPEELTTAVLQCVHALLSTPAAGAAVQKLTESTEQVHFVAYVISSLLHISERQRNHDLAELTVFTLKLLLENVRQLLILRQYFPGVCVGMWKAMSSPLQTTKVIVAAMDCFTLIISRCLNDEDSGQRCSPDSQFSIDGLREHHYSIRISELPSTEDEWLQQATQKINLLMSQVLAPKFVSQQPWRVLIGVVELCSVVLRKCRHTLRGSFFSCFEELMVLRTHGIPQVSQAASAAVLKLQTIFSPVEWLAMESRFAERFEILLSTLDLKCGTELEAVLVYQIKVLIGYIDFQQLHFRVVLDDMMASVLRVLSHLFAFESLDVDLMRNVTVEISVPTDTGSESREITLPYFQKRFVHLHEEASVTVAVQLLTAIGTVATPAVIVDAAFIVLMEANLDVSSCNATLVVLNECLRAVSAGLNNEDSVHFVGRVLDDLVTLPWWISSPSNAKNSVALLVECVGICVDLVGPSVGCFLLHILYDLVEKLGDPAIQVERAAHTALVKIAVYSGHAGDLHALFGANMDYLVDALCARLTHLDIYPESPQVVEALLRNTTISALPLVDEITNSLLRAVDVYQNEAGVIEVLLRSLHLLVANYNEEEDKNLVDIPVRHKTKLHDISQLERFLLETRAWADEDSAHEHEDTEGQTPAVHEDLTKAAMPIEFSDTWKDPEPDDDDSEQQPLPFQLQTVEIVERCSYFLADCDPMTCCLVLRTIGVGVRYLRTRRKELLPLVHRLWPSILHRLHVSNRPVLIETLQLLSTIADCAADFIGDRFIETAWPPIRVLLSTALGVMVQDGEKATSLDMVDRHHAETTTKKTRGRTLEEKMVQAALSCLRQVCANAETVASIVPDITDTCLGFLHSQLPDSVTAATEELLLTVGTLNGDEVFVRVSSIASWHPSTPPSTRFPQYDDQLKSTPTPRDLPVHGIQANASRLLVKLIQQG